MLYAHTAGDLEEKWQSLEEHLHCVAERAAEFAVPFHGEHFARLIGLLHDLGKASEAFQKRLRGLGPKVDHSSAGARELLACWSLASDPKLRGAGRWLAWLLAYCITGHHAGLPNHGESPEDPASLWMRLTRSEIPDYSPGLSLVSLPSPEELRIPLRPEATPAFTYSFFVRMLFSCLTDADWLDTERCCDPLRAGLRKHLLPSMGALAKLLETRLKEKNFFEEGAENRLGEALPRPTLITVGRKAILNCCLKAAELEPGAFSLTVPTGGGKTLSSLAFALEHARRHGLRRVILVAPYTSIIEQNAAVLRDLLGEEAVLEHHGNYLHPGEESDDVESTQEALRFRLATENWEASIVVTTAVQFFESLFSCRPGRCRKLHNIVRSVVVLDEAQMMPIALLAPSVAALRELVRHYGVSVVFCTATQPALERADDFKCGFPKEEIREIIPDGISRRLFEIFKRVEVSHIGTLKTEELACRIAEQKQTLCIVNTRKAARNLYDALLEETHDHSAVFHLSSLMTPAHRSDMLTRIRARLDEKLPCLVISTSLIECGVDISFPAVFREENGLDSLAQAAGRCNRGGEWERGQVFVFSFADAPSKPMGDVARRAAIFRDVAQRFSDLFSPEAVGEFFHQQRIYDNVDGKNILSDLEKTARLSPKEPYFDFRSMDSAYCFIEPGMTSVIVECDLQGDRESADLVRCIETFDASSSVYRKLQRHTVQIRPHELKRLRAAGNVELVAEQFYVVRGGVGYRPDVGLCPDDPLWVADSDLIF